MSVFNIPSFLLLAAIIAMGVFAEMNQPTVFEPPAEREDVWAEDTDAEEQEQGNQTQTLFDALDDNGDGEISKSENSDALDEYRAFKKRERQQQPREPVEPTTPAKEVQKPDSEIDLDDTWYSFLEMPGETELKKVIAQQMQDELAFGTLVSRPPRQVKERRRLKLTNFFGETPYAVVIPEGAFIVRTDTLETATDVLLAYNMRPLVADTSEFNGSELPVVRMVVAPRNSYREFVRAIEQSPTARAFGPMGVKHNTEHRPGWIFDENTYIVNTEVDRNSIHKMYGQVLWTGPSDVEGVMFITRCSFQRKEEMAEIQKILIPMFLSIHELE